MLAGLAIIASRTCGHSDVLAISPEVGFLYEPHDFEGLAAILERLSHDSDLLARTKVRALEAARDHWNWERESRTLIAAVARIGDTPTN